jgi:hypothetical protein
MYVSMCVCVCPFSQRTAALKMNNFFDLGTLKPPAHRRIYWGGIGSGNRKKNHEKLMKKVSERS